MSKLLVEEKKIVLPGEVIAEGMDFLPGKGAFREGDNLVSSKLGLLNMNGRVVHIIPLSGRYVPKRDDVVIGYVKDMSYSSWFVDVGYAYEASLSLKDATADFIERGSSLSDYFAVGEVILTRISNVTREGNIDLTMKAPGLRKLQGGKIVDITPSKIPRVVGKQGSMISLIKDKTGCTIFAGQNGRVWIRGSSPEAEKLATDAILLIEEHSHTSGLTDRVAAFLEQHAMEIKK
ncbi:RNA-binding protein [Candidatus Woesearchaeota archaeon]|nr:RNA-binding protein [Candidatus Woesearchaeota archaeon]